MKKLLSIILLAAISAPGFGQGSKTDTSLVNLMRLNFAVPDQPAFSILGTQPSEILRPSTLNELSLVVSQFYDKNSISIPRSFALEIAPAILIQRHITIEQYKKLKPFYNIRISIGSQRRDDNNYNLAIGLRTTLYDKGDMVSDKAFVKNVDLEISKFNEQTVYFDEAAISITNTARNKNYNVSTLMHSGSKKDSVYFDSTRKALINKGLSDKDYKILAANRVNAKFYDKYKKKYSVDTLDHQMDRNSEQVIFYLNEMDRLKDLIISYNEENYVAWINEIKNNHKLNNWNKQRLDVAFAWLSRSPDSLIKNLRTSKVAGWVTWACLRFGKWGQGIIGLNYTHTLTDTIIESKEIRNSYDDFSVPFRLYMGVNRYKGFLELQYKFDGLENKNDGLLNLGAEINVTPGIWLQLNGGYIYEGLLTSNVTQSLFTHFDVKFAIPENFNIFK